jgi:hypothetical protein
VTLYRFYLLGDDQHIHRPQLQFDLPDDSEAVIKAGSLLNSDDKSFGIEIWESARLVKRLGRS